MKWWLTLGLPFFVLDQATKFWVLRNIPSDESKAVIPGVFHLVQVHNTGAAFGMLKDNNWFFIGLASVALVVLVVLTLRKAFPDTLSQVAAALLASGVAGNLTDRILHGHVIDFLQVFLPFYGEWPSFNIADSCICVAAGLFILSSLIGDRRKEGTRRG